MSEMGYKEFTNDFRKGITRDVLFFYGEEEYLMNWAKDRIIEKYTDEEWRSIDVRYLDGSSVTPYEIMAESRAFSMFSERRVVIVNNFAPLHQRSSGDGLDELLEFAGDKLVSSVLIFILGPEHRGNITQFGRKLIRKCSAYEFASLDKADLRSFITKRIHSRGKIISARNLDYLIDLTGYYNKESNYDLTRLESDLAKITGASVEDDIQAGVIEDLLTSDADKFVFNLVDAAVSGNRARALEIAEAIIREEDGAMQVTSLLTKQYEIMYDALCLSEKGMSISAMAKMTGVNEFRFKKACQAARAYSKKDLGTLLISLYNIDRNIKRGDIDKDIALELFCLTAASGRMN